VATSVHDSGINKLPCISQHKQFTFLFSFLHALELDLWEFEKICKEKLQVRKEKKMARVKPYEKM
jgi:competence protein ComGF